MGFPKMIIFSSLTINFCNFALRLQVSRLRTFEIVIILNYSKVLYHCFLVMMFGSLAEVVIAFSTLKFRAVGIVDHL